MPLFLLASSVAHFIVPGCSPTRSHAQNLGYSRKLFIGGLEGRSTNRPPRKPKLTQHPEAQRILDQLLETRI
ncbi:hypothetical protein QUB40_12130 [Microcoleus sp. AT9_A2]|uniref:hypothetical protein n=1 Tax=Microcoleus sp. AT9_A2 TaxID=2818624 RepID=UPI002FD2FD4E